MVSSIKALGGTLFQSTLTYLQATSFLQRMGHLLFVWLVAGSGAMGMYWWGLEGGVGQKLFTDRLKHYLTSSREIQVVLNNALRATGASRILIQRFHDGQRVAGNAHFYFQSAEYEAYVQGLSPVLLELQRVPLQFMPGMLQVANGECVSHPGNASPAYQDFAQKLGGARVVVKCPVHSQRGYPIGLISASYLSAEAVPDREGLLLTLQNYAQALTGLLREER